MGHHHSESFVTYAEDMAHRSVPSLELPGTPGPIIVLLKTQSFMFHFKQLDSKQIVSKVRRIVFRNLSEMVGGEENIDPCRVDFYL